MATLFLDYENGNDNYAGTSFDLLASGTDGRISSSTFSSVSASFPDDDSLIGQYLSIYNGSIYAVYEITAWESSTSLTIAQISGGTSLSNQTVDRQYYIGGRWQTKDGITATRIIPGDTIRVMGSPAPTSIGNATWTSGQLQNTVNPGNNNFSNATPIVVTRIGHGLNTGDVVVVTGVTGNTNANGTWDITVINANSFSLDGSSGNGTSSSGSYRLRNNTRVQLASALTQTIASTGPRSAWTASTNVTTTLNTTDYKEHQYSDSIAIAAGFTTGKAAYWATGTLDLSSYQQVSFWIKQTAGTIGAANAVSINLCSDATGDTTINTVNIPNLTALNQWILITVDLGSALGSSIQSIAFYVNTDNGAQTFLVNNIIACKASSNADALTLSSLIGKNRADDTWYGIQSINGTRVMLDGETNARPVNDIRGYSHSSGTETVASYKRECIKTVMQSNNVVGVLNSVKAGTADALITLSGGWDRTDMSTQTLETWLDGQNGLGNGLHNYHSFNSFDNFGLVRYQGGIGTNAGQSLTFASNIHSSCNTAGIMTSNTANIFYLSNSFIQGVSLSFQSNNTDAFFNLSNIRIYNSRSQGIPTSLPAVFKNGEIRNCNIAIMAWRNNDNTYESIVTADNGTGVQQNGVISKIYLNNVTLNDTIQVAQNGMEAYTYSMNHDNTPGNHKIFSFGGLIIADISNRHTASGFSWKLSPTSTLRTSYNPLKLSLAKVAVAANALVTIKAWMYRDNSGLTMRLVCKGGQIAGVTSDVTSVVTAVDSWEEQTITFTPTEQGVVEITAEAYGGSTYNGWVDDMTISQAV